MRRLAAALCVIALLALVGGCAPPDEDFSYPDSAELPLKPWFADGDRAFTRIPDQRHPRSAEFIEYLKSTGRLIIHTGSTKLTSDGRTSGIYLNKATTEDDARTITPFPFFSPKNLTVWDGAGWRSAPYGETIHLPDPLYIQGHPMTGYSDRKVHVFNVDTRVVWEVQHFEWWPGGGIRAHGVKRYHLDADSSDARGSSAIGLPISYLTLRYDDVMNGWVQLSHMGIKAASGDYVYPARGSDGTSKDSSAPPMGVILRLKQSAYNRILDSGPGPQTKAVLRSYVGPGIIIGDTGGTNSSGLEPDNRWDQDDLAPLRDLTWDDFEVWTLDPPS